MKPINYAQLTQIISSYQYIIADKKLIELYPKIGELLELKTSYLVEEPEAAKTINDYEKILVFLLDHGMTRSDEILVIGGGATSDLGGFVASTILRGVKWSVIPSTLLSMVDASIGGKVGINTVQGKNLVGNFHSPVHIYVYLPFLETLSKDEYQSGLGEVVKYAFLDKAIFDLIKDESGMETIVAACSKFKHEVVSLDFKEKGARKILNLGHSFGHAFEKSLGIPHGKAVIQGLRLIIDLYAKNLLQQFDAILKKLQIEEQPIACDFDEFWNYFQRDKKMSGKSEIELIIPRDIGDVSIEKMNIQIIKSELRQNEFYKTYFS